MHENVPVRFGRGRLDSLATKGLAAYLIANHVSSTFRPERQREERKRIAKGILHGLVACPGHEGLPPGVGHEDPT